jgi:hypothetical protein
MYSDMTFFLKSTTHFGYTNKDHFFYTRTFLENINSLFFTISILYSILENHMYKLLPNIALIIL